MKTLFSCTIILYCFMSTVTAQQVSKEILYIGTSSERGSKGIYVFEFDRKKQDFRELQTLTHKQSPTFLELHPNGKVLYAVYREGLEANDKSGTVTAFAINQETGALSLINEHSSEGAGPCHVSVDPKGEYVYVSNYGGGNLAVYPIRPDGGLLAPSDVVQHTGSSIHPSRQKQAYMHSIIPSPHNDVVYASDLGVDKIYTYRIDRGSGKLSEVAVVSSTPGSGPRHFALSPNNKLAFSAEELSSTIASFKVDPSSGELTPLERVPMLSGGMMHNENNTAADIHVSPDGRYVYASNRGEDNLVIYAVDAKTGKMNLVGHESTRGGHPRNFYMDRLGEFVLVANRDNDHFVLFDRDQDSGKLAFTNKEVHVPAAVCIKLLSLQK